MKTFLVTATNATALQVLATITRVDPMATVQYPNGAKTVMRIRSERLSLFSLESIDGVAQVALDHRYQAAPLFLKVDA